MRQCYIIGYPLKKPRSILLWKRFFKKHKINSSMSPIEVKKNNVNIFIKKIKKNKNFLASAVTMPIKNEIFKYITPGDKVAYNTKAINFILKKNNKIYGYNTDILALLSLIEKKYLKNVLILGLGGVGNALFNYLKKNKNLKIFALSSKKKGKNIFSNINKVDLSRITLLINCTPVGSSLKNLKNKSPINFKDLMKISKKSMVFDIIYNPKNTKLLNYSKKLGLKTSNGIKMNTIQADIALNMLLKTYE